MIDVSVWMNGFLQALDTWFGGRIWFVGLQGSYGRGEATEASDIDVVVILDELSAGDIQTYNEMLDTLPHRELICGFLSGKSEILNWDAADLFQFYYDTTPVWVNCCRCWMKRLSAGRSKQVHAISIMAAYIICCTKRAKKF